ncbi:MAG: LysM peptidoglycan-binding domain-containing protein [Verrucomicrobiota bacterium]
MKFSFLRPVTVSAILGFSCGSLFSQTVAPPRAAASKVEPGLEQAVGWKWWVAPSATKEWGMPLPEALVPKDADTLDPAVIAAERPETYEVIKGDALVKIAKKFDMTVAQLKLFNGLKDDRIKIGQELRIPTLEELLTLIPPPPPPKAAVVGKKEDDKSAETPETEIDTDFEARMELDNVRLQVFLDREMFSPGMIDGKSGGTFLKISEIYQRTHPDAADPARLKAKAEATVSQPYTVYALRADDFKFIKWPKDEPKVAPGGKVPATKNKSSKPAAAAPAPAPPPVTIDELVAADFLCYTNAWEFVAERFHCDEAFLRRINPQIKDTPVVGTEFQIPNVIPFEIEKALDAPLQPAADPQKPVTAAVVLLSRLEISQEGKLIAVLPLTTARPGLRGRDKWTVLDAIPQPRMATKREPLEAPKPKPAAPGDAVPSAAPVIAPPLEKEQYLAPGPNNPVGIVWINLAKDRSTAPLPYGFHGTSMPAKMKLEGIGGLRLTNWDIARAARLMPAGTVLQWKAQ